MTTVEIVLLMLLVAIAISLGAFILLQHGKGADVGAAFGSGGANTMFGSAGTASFLTKATAWLAIGFFGISFALAFVAKERAGRLGIEGVPVAPTEVAADAEVPDAVPGAGDAIEAAGAAADDLPPLSDDAADDPASFDLPELEESAPVVDDAGLPDV